MRVEFAPTGEILASEASRGHYSSGMSIHAPRWSSSFVLLALALVPAWATGVRAQSTASTVRSKYVILVMTDGFRWQELFTGADPGLVRSTRGGDTAAVRAAFDRETPTARREALMPFVWSTIATHGQILGDASAGSASQLTNGMKFSYPGYNEVLTGHPDPRIDSNRHGSNANRSVFAWLNAQPSLAGQVAVFGGWSAFPRIFNSVQSGVPVYNGSTAVMLPAQSPRQTMTGRFMGLLQRYLPSITSDAVVGRAAAAYQVTATPRVLFVGFNETDHWGHASRYDRYLTAAHQVDAFLAEIWANAQANPATRDSTTLIVTTDHGRGDGGDWFAHGRTVAGAERIWIAAIGPDIPARGVRRETPSTQSQVAATVAAAVGLDWTAAEPKAAAALPVFEMTSAANGAGTTSVADSVGRQSVTPPSRPSPVPAPDRPAATARPR